MDDRDEAVPACLEWAGVAEGEVRSISGEEVKKRVGRVVKEVWREQLDNRNFAEENRVCKWCEGPGTLHAGV